MVFDDIWRDSLCRSYQGFWQLARQTRHWHERLIQLTHVSCHLFHDLWWKWLGKVSNFTGGNTVFLSRIRIFVFWLFLCIKFCVKPRRTLNGSQETFLGSFLWLDVSSNKITKGKLNFHSCFPPSFRSRFPPLLVPSPVPLPLLPGSSPPVPPNKELRCNSVACVWI